MVAAVNRRPRAAAARGLETRGRAGRAQRHSSQHPAGASAAHNSPRRAGSSASSRSRLGTGKIGAACPRSGLCSWPCSRRSAGSRSNSSEHASGRGLCGNRGQHGPHGCGARGRYLRGGNHTRCRDNGGGSRRLRRSSTATGGVASSCGRAARWRKYAVRCGKSAAHRSRSAAGSPRGGIPDAGNSGRTPAHNRRASNGTDHGGLDAPQRRSLGSSQCHDHPHGPAPRLTSTAIPDRLCSTPLATGCLLHRRHDHRSGHRRPRRGASQGSIAAVQGGNGSDRRSIANWHQHAGGLTSGRGTGRSPSGVQRGRYPAGMVHITQAIPGRRRRPQRRD